MNIIELAREAGLLAEDEAWVSPHQEAMQAFTNAVIAARDKELIDGAGEPVHHIMSDGKCIGYYSVEQVAVAVAKARKDAYQELLNKDWTEIMREGALVTWGDAETLGDRVVALIQEKQGGATC